MAWFPDDTENSLGWRVQFMGVVAWLGASAIEKHANAMIGSKFSWIPRIVPGPWHFPDAGLVRYDYKTIPTLRAAVCQARPEFPFVGKLANDKIHMVVPEMQDSNIRGSVFAPTDGERREVGALLLPYARSAKRSLLPLLSFILFLFFFSNATDISQITITAAYIILTSFYIIVRPLGINPGELGVATIYDWLSPTSHLAKPTERYTERLPTIARTVWYAIRLTNSTTWVRPIDAIPDTPEWNQWLEEARKNMKTPDWPAEGEAQRLVDNAQHVYDIQEPRRRSNDQDSLRISPVPEADW
ncbi:hypothetical protein NW752_003368 [Fusarium irregulare]|nr:hypothetical protein NW752_003368 [Fusarium irregulare]